MYKYSSYNQAEYPTPFLTKQHYSLAWIKLNFYKTITDANGIGTNSSCFF